MKHILLLLMITSCTATSIIDTGTEAVIRWSDKDVELLNIITNYRQEYQLHELEINNDMKIEAVKRAEYLQEIGSITHNGYSILKKNIEAKGYEYVSELLVYKYNTPQSAFDALIRSSPHREYLKRDTFKYIGIHITEDAKYYIILLGT